MITSGSVVVLGHFLMAARDKAPVVSYLRVHVST